MRDHFIDANGVSATHRVPNVTAYNEYHEIDWATSTWTDSSITVLLLPDSKATQKKKAEGLMAHDEELRVAFRSTDTIDRGDLLMIDSLTYRIIELNTKTYQGTTIKKGRLRKEPQGA